MNKVFLSLSVSMGLIVLASNFLVQFPIKYYGLEEILTYGAFSYPVAFLITDLANRSYGKTSCKKDSLYRFCIWSRIYSFVFNKFCRFNFSKNCFGSGIAFLVAQLIDVQDFDKLREKTLVYCSAWFVFNWFNN